MMAGFDLSVEYDFDEDAEVNGVWEDLGNGASVKVAHTGNPKYKEVMKGFPRQVMARAQSGRIKTEEELHYICLLAARTLLTGFKGLHEKGVLLEYSERSAYDILKAHKGFRSKIAELADDEDRFRAETLEDDEKNSLASLNGNSNTEV